MSIGTQRCTHTWEPGTWDSHERIHTYNNAAAAAAAAAVAVAAVVAHVLLASTTNGLDTWLVAAAAHGRLCCCSILQTAELARCTPFRSHPATSLHHCTYTTH
uniref:Uncharacterized protein n=1 Tax=Trichogramma kaykai TaxID=54128 RepID=A0ABD2XCW3_9HYME